MRRFIFMMLVVFLAVPGVLLADKTPIQDAPTRECFYPHSGYVYDNHGSPLDNIRVKMTGGGYGSPQYRYTDSSGFYSHSPYCGLGSLTIELDDSSISDCNVSPASYYDPYCSAPISNWHFTVTCPTHIVRGTINSGAGNPENGGVNIYVNNAVVAQTNSSGHYSFSPADLGIPENGLIRCKKSLHSFWPTQLYYNVASGDDYVDDCNISMTDLADLAGVDYSWETSGIGISYFVSTPNNVAFNNPDFLVDLAFDYLAMSTTIPAQYVRLISTSGDFLPAGGITSETDISRPNYSAQFRHPLGENNCEQLDLVVEVGRLQEGGNIYWEAINSPFHSGVSDLDLYDDDVVNLCDIVIYSSTLNRCEGDPQFVPCADFYPSGCIDLNDLVVFSTLYFARPEGKAATSTPGASATLYPSDNALDLSLNSETDWDAAVIRFAGGTKGQALPKWSPDKEFAEYSVLVPDENGGFGLVLVGPNPGLEVSLGSLLRTGDSDLNSWSIVSVETIASSQVGMKALNADGSPAVASPDFRAAPNPFNPQTVLKFNQIEAGPVALRIFDSAGRLVRTLVDENRASGAHEVVWNGKDGSGRRSATGVYFAKLVQSESSSVQKLVLLK